MRILFMGTPDFAACSLKALYENGYRDMTVVTQPDKPQGRKMILTPSAVKVCAESLSLPLYQPATLRDEAFDTLLKKIDPEIIIVAAYGKILPKSVIDYPGYGCINVHGSLLPKYRGAAPIQRALIDGESVTGITIMYMDEGLDTGDMLSKTELQISEDDDAQTLFNKMSIAGAELLLKTLPDIISGKIKPEKQDEALATYASKVDKNDCLIDFKNSAKSIHDRVRGLSPFLYAYAVRGQVQLKIVKTAMTDMTSDKPVGSLITDGKRLYVVCGNKKCLELLYVLPAGKKLMSASDYLRGNPVKEGERLNASEE